MDAICSRILFLPVRDAETRLLFVVKASSLVSSEIPLLTKIFRPLFRDVGLVRTALILVSGDLLLLGRKVRPVVAGSESEGDTGSSVEEICWRCPPTTITSPTTSPSSSMDGLRMLSGLISLGL